MIQKDYFIIEMSPELEERILTILRYFLNLDEAYDILEMLHNGTIAYEIERKLEEFRRP